MLKRTLIQVAIMAAYAGAQAASAENTTEQAANNNPAVAEVVIVGTSPLTSLGTSLRQVPANVQIATGKQISQQGSLNLGEFMDSNLGSVNSSNSAGNPYQMDISYRGFTASPILGTAIGLSVFLDGVRVNEPFGDIVNWDLIPANAIASINLIPGSNPLFGLNTLGGAIAVETKNGASNPGFTATVSGGSWGRRAVAAEVGGVDAAHDMDYFVATNIFHEDGYRDFSSSDIRQFFTKERWHDAQTRLELSLALADNSMYGTSVLPSSMLNNPSYAYTAPDNIKNKNVLLALKGSRSIDDDKLIDGNIYYRGSNAINSNSNASCDNSVISPENCVANQSNGDLDASNIISSTRQHSIGASLQLSLLGDVMGHKNTFTAGASLDASKVSYLSSTYGANLVGEVTYTIDPSGANAINPSNPFYQGGVNLTTQNNYYGLFATDNFALNDQWNLTLSGRYNYATVDLSGSSNDGNGNIGDLNGKHAYHRLNPAVGVNYNPAKNLTLYAAYNEGMRAPSPVELSCANPAQPCALPTGFTSDPDLHMIVSKTLEAGMRGKISSAIGWDFALYNTENKNDIQFIANGSNNGVTGFFQNVGTTQRRGLEFGLQGKFDNLTLSANYGFVKATYETAFTEAAGQNSTVNPVTGLITVNKGNQIPGVARQTLKLRASMDVNPVWNVGSNVVASSGQYAHGDENNQDINGPLAAYAVVNLDSHYTLSSKWQLFAKVTNLFDRNYSTFGILGQNMFTAQNELAQVPAAGRGVWLGLSYQFGGHGGSGH